MSPDQILFYFFAVLVIGSALLVVTIKNLVRSIFLFFVTLFSVAGIYIFALADFVAISQVIIYVGGVLVLMLFAFLLSNKDLLENLQPQKAKFLNVPSWSALLIVLAFMCSLCITILHANADGLYWVENSTQQLKATDNTIHHIGISIMTRYLLPFEVVSVFLMMALIGAAHLARKERME